MRRRPTFGGGISLDSGATERGTPPKFPHPGEFLVSKNPQKAEAIFLVEKTFTGPKDHQVVKGKGGVIGEADRTYYEAGDSLPMNAKGELAEKLFIRIKNIQTGEITEALWSDFSGSHQVDTREDGEIFNIAMKDNKPEPEPQSEPERNIADPIPVAGTIDTVVATPAQSAAEPEPDDILNQPGPVLGIPGDRSRPVFPVMPEPPTMGSQLGEDEPAPVSAPRISPGTSADAITSTPVITRGGPEPVAPDLNPGDIAAESAGVQQEASGGLSKEERNRREREVESVKGVIFDSGHGYFFRYSGYDYYDEESRDLVLREVWSKEFPSWQTARFGATFDGFMSDRESLRRVSQEEFEKHIQEFSIEPQPTVPENTPSKEEQEKQERLAFIRNATGRLFTMKPEANIAKADQYPVRVVGGSDNGATLRYELYNPKTGEWIQYQAEYQKFIDTFVIDEQSEEQRDNIEDLKGQVYKSKKLQGFIKAPKDARGIVRIVSSSGNGYFVNYGVFDEKTGEWGDKFKMEYKKFFSTYAPLGLTDSELEAGAAENRATQEAKAEAKKPRSTAERLGLTPQQRTDREALEEKVVVARQEYIKHQHDFEQKSKSLIDRLRLKHIENTDTGYLERYKRALEELRKFDESALGAALVDQSPEAQRASVESYLKRFSVEEWSKSWTEREEQKIVNKRSLVSISSWLEGTAFGKWYQDQGKVLKTFNFFGHDINLTTGQIKRMAVGGLLLGAHAFALPSVATATTASYIVFRLTTGMLAYNSVATTASKLTQGAADKWGGSTKDTKEILKDFNNGAEITPEMLARLNKATEDYIAGIDTKMRQKRRQNVIAKSLSAGIILGVPGMKALGFLGGIGAGGGSAEAASGPVAGSDARLETPDRQVPGTGAAAAAAAQGEGGPRAGDAPASAATETGGSGEPQPTPDKSGEAAAEPGKETSTDESAAPAEAKGVAPTYKLEIATVAAGDRARGLWGILERQLAMDSPGLTETEQNRQILSMQNLIRTKLEGLTDAQIEAQYGLSSRDINLIHVNEEIKLGSLVSEAEMKAIAEGKNWTFSPGVDADAVAASDAETDQPAADSDPAVDQGGADTQSGAALDSVAKDIAAASAAEEAAGGVPNKPVDLLEGLGFVSSAQAATLPLDSSLGKAADAVQSGGGRSISLPPIDRMQGNYNMDAAASSDSYRPNIQDGLRAAEASAEGGVDIPQYSFEDSSKDRLFEEYANTDVNIRTLHGANMMNIGRELMDIDTTQYGPNYQPTGMTEDRLLRGREFNMRPMNGIIDRQGGQFVSTYQYAPGANEAQPTMLYPRGLQGPDVNARAFENDVVRGFTGRIADMANQATRDFGSAGSPLKDERLVSYLNRIGTLVTRRRLADSNYNFDF